MKRSKLNFCKKLDNLMSIAWLAAALLMLGLYFVFIEVAQVNAKAQEVVNNLTTESHAETMEQIEARIIEFERIEGIKKAELEEVIRLANLNFCNLEFFSLKDRKYINPPQWFVDRIQGYNCNQKKWLTRLAHYESNYNVNAKNGAFTGLYQIGKSGANLTSHDSTFGWCYENGHAGSDEECALWLVTWLPLMPLQFETYVVYKDSFKDLTFK